jgi:DNA-3-methyladenine glycosylase II
MTAAESTCEALTAESYAQALSWLQRDAALAAVLAEYGPPPIWQRSPGFGTLVHIILEQQVSLASARAAYDRLLSAAGQLDPTRFLEFTDDQLKGFGFSRQKSGYARELASSVLEGRLSFDALTGLSDDDVRRELLRLPGIGPWTANIYLLMALQRPDVWPSGDRALAVAAQSVLGLPQVPSYDALAALAERWRPYRSVAARVLWHHYLSGRSGYGVSGAA